MPRKKSPYAAVNERRRKREWNRRSTAQLARQRKARHEASVLGYSPENPHHSKKGRPHGLVSTGYLQSLMLDREEVLREAREMAEARRADEARVAGYIPVREHAREEGTIPVEAHERRVPRSATHAIAELMAERHETP